MSIRRQNLWLQDGFDVDLGHPQETSTKTLDLFQAPADRAAVVDRVSIMNPTGLATDDTNYVDIAVKNGSATVAHWSTKLTGGTGALVAGTLAFPALSATLSDLQLAAGAKLTLVITATGSPTLPAGAVRVEGRLL